MLNTLLHYQPKSFFYFEDKLFRPMKLLILLLFVPFNIYAAICGCGSPASGSVIWYNTMHSSNCCDLNDVAELAFEDIYVMDSNGNSRYVGTNEITASAAVDACCPPA